MGLKFVQWQINVSIHETTGQSPFKVTFGEEPRIGLESYVLPKSQVDTVKAEEKIEEFLTSQEANDEDSLSRDGKTTFIKAQKEAASGQTRAAAKMTRRSKKMLIPLQIGQNCTLRVPDVDRGPADPNNFLLRAAKDVLSAYVNPAAYLVDAVAAEKEYYAILVVTPGSHEKYINLVQNICF
ncbi:hypothetical protein T06_3587 [Trichinella sp. T6]|nr:hypothetical protein T06_12821 [Trichinella sp. T6]KRX69079.1 hypothetical protein T06_3587 [Trichinella sp. T6]